MSDSNTLGASGLVVGTAGHIDHGKTTLVRALTGIDTDTLKEEKLRGISIDLGFANLQMPGCAPISFIDVPGHERFIKNMLAGAAGIQAVILVVAAGESVKPQTREHFDICRLLGIRRGLIVLTKSDLAAPEQIAKTTGDIKALVAQSFLEHAPVIPVSAITGSGMETLKQHLCKLAAHQPAASNAARNDSGLFRLAVDRSFTLKGFGAVVTGTLSSGPLCTGDAVQIYPQKLLARVRGLQMHHAQVSSAAAGQRLAVNLSGVEHSSIARGNVIAPPGLLDITSMVDIRVDWLDAQDAPARSSQIFVHSGTSETLATIKLIDPPFARLRLAQPLLLLPDDRIVLRLPSPARTVAGAAVIDPFPPRRLNRAKAAARLTTLSIAATHSARIQILVAESPAGLAVSQLVRMLGAPTPHIESLITGSPALMLTPSGVVFARASIDKRRQVLTAWLTDFHAKNPGAAGAPLSLARRGLDAPLAEAVFTGFPALRIQGDLVSLATHQAAFSAADTMLMQKLEHAFLSTAFQPPSPAEVVQSIAGGKRAGQLLEILVKSQRLIRISDQLIFHADVIAHIRQSLAQQKGRRFSVAEFKSWTNISRKYAIPLLEYLDQHRVTRREGDARIVL